MSLQLSHGDFVEKYNNGHLSVTVNKYAKNRISNDLRMDEKSRKSYIRWHKIASAFDDDAIIPAWFFSIIPIGFATNLLADVLFIKVSNQNAVFWLTVILSISLWVVLKVCLKKPANYFFRKSHESVINLTLIEPSFYYEFSQEGLIKINYKECTVDYDEVIRKYGYTLEHNCPKLCSVSDVKKLPYQKEIIKHAILSVLNDIEDGKMKESLIFGYMYLANWQVGVGTKDIGIKLPANRVEGAISEIEVDKCLNDYLESSNKFQKFQKLIDNEAHQLEKELAAHGFSMSS